MAKTYRDPTGLESCPKSLDLRSQQQPGRSARGRGLVVGGHAGIADQHPAILRQGFATRKPLKSLTLKIVAKGLGCETIDSQKHAIKHIR